MKHLIAITLIFQLTSCASIFVPRMQKVTIVTGQPKAIAYLDKEEFGIGDSVTRKIAKSWTKEIVVKAEGFKDSYVALIPTHRPVGYWICQIFNAPFDLIFFYPTSIDNSSPRNLAYERRTVVNLTKLKKKETTEKYIEIANISLDIKNKDKDINDNVIIYEKDMNAKIANYEEQMAKRDELQAQLESKKKKKKTLSNDGDKKINYENTKFSELLYKMLRNTGYIDTVNKVFSDNNNTLILEGKITRVNFYRISVPKDEGPFYYKSNVFLTWYVKNTYDEILDSVVTNQISGDFMKSKGEEYFNEKILGDAIEQSYINLHNNAALINNIKLETDFTPNLSQLALNEPKDVVVEKQYAQEASVIIKTKKGHGSGFAITNDGYIITNYHVISGTLPNQQCKVTVITSEGQEMQAEVIRYNKARDLALLKVEKNFAKAFKCKSEKTFKNMQDIYTIGAPKSIELGQSISIGILSNERKINNNNLIQLGISVNSGNSGGPVFDAAGVLHGVIVSKLVGQNTEGIGFAIPGYLIQNYLKIEYK